MFRRTGRGPGRRNDRGAVAVEAALITPVLLIVVFGIVEFGLVFKDWLAVSSSVRAGTRIASAEPRVATFATDAAAQIAREGSAMDMDGVRELWVYKAAVDGSPVGGNGGFGACTSCVKFRWDGTKFTQISSTWPHTAQNACQGDVNRDNLGVYLQLEHAAITGMFFDRFVISEHTVMALEPMSATTGCK